MTKLILGPFDKGLQKDVTAFNIEQNSFERLINAYQWRGRIKRKRGTALLNRLQRKISISIALTQSGGTEAILPNFPIVIGTINFVGSVDGTTYKDVNKNGTLTATGGTGTGGTINYVTGLIHINGGAGETLNGTLSYYPCLPVMGLEDLELIPTQFPGEIAFDTKYAYDISPVFPYSVTDVTFYKNPPVNPVTLPNYVPKIANTPFTWNGKDYQQFWTENDQGALFATNGITIPFSITNIGMQYKNITNVTVISGGPPATATLTIVNHGLVVGDFVYVNEVVGTTGINFQTGYVIDVTDVNNVIVEFPNAIIAGNGIGGIAQYLTNTADATKDPIRFYDGLPGSNLGWVNFSPPLSQSNFSIAGLPLAQYYLAGARLIISFKDRLLFLGCVVQNSGGGIFYLPDTIIYNQNGTPYYTASFKDAVDASNTVFHPILVPINQTATAPAWFEDDTGFGGYISAGISQPITTVATNEDVLIVGFSFTKTRVAYTGNDLIPFLFYSINSELGDASPFSVIDMDKGIITRGTRGYIVTSQNQAQRIDLLIPDNVFQIDLTNNGNERFTAVRNFLDEWIYFTYNSNNSPEGKSNTAIFPNQSLFYNYRDNSWAIFNESYTTYGNFRKQTGFTWATVGLTYPTWSDWNDPWNASSSTLEQQILIGGNQQGFVMVRDVGTGEGTSLYILSFLGANVINSPDHNLNNDDYIIISGVLGTIGSLVNDKIYKIFNVSRNSFSIDYPSVITGTYLGGGLITVAYVPNIMTKQFPMAWEMARKTRLGVQQYLFTTTPNNQITLQIYLSQNSNDPYNNPPIVPNVNSTNNILIYSQVLFTCPESANLGLTPANYNLNTPTARQQAQIWHRMNTSLIGDTVQIGFTLSDLQMRDLITNNATAEIELHGGILEISPSALLC